VEHLLLWNEKGELKYNGETVQGSNLVDLVNDVLRKRKYFNPQGWETFGEALREANVPQDSPFSFQLMSGLLFIFFNKSCALAFIVFGTLSKISSSTRSCLA
jgi:hypothetical protein